MSGSGSTTRHTIEVFYQVTGADKTASTFTSVNKAVDNNTRLLQQNYNAANKTAIGTRDLAIAQKTVDTSIRNTDGTLNKFTSTTTKSEGATKKFADAIRGNKGLAFGMVGLLTSGIEALGMLSMWNDMNKNLSEAQAQLNELVDAGITSGSAYTRAVNLVNDAQRGLNFTQRNLVLSFFDLVPFLLLTTTGLMNVLKHAGGAKSALDKLGSTVSGLISNIGKSKTPLNDLNTSIGVTFPQSATRAGKSMGSFITPIGVEFPKNVGKASSVSSKFTGLLHGLAGGFKAAGLAAVSFGRMLAGALILNPVGLAITAVTVALGVLMFDLGGVRTKLKEVGQAWGEQVPILKPVIDHYIKAGDNLGYIGQRIIDFVFGAKEVNKSFIDITENLLKYEGAARVTFLTQEGFNDVQAESVQIHNAIDKVLQGEVDAFDNLNNSLQKSAEYVLGVISTHEELGEVTVDTVKNIIANQEAADAFGDSVRYAKDGNIDFTKSYDALIDAENKFTADLQKGTKVIINHFENGVLSFQRFEKRFEILKKVYPEFSDIAEKEHQKVINWIFKNAEKYPELAKEAEEAGYKIQQSMDNSVIAAYEKWEAKQNLIMDVHNTMTDSVLADKTLVAKKVEELEAKYGEFGITAEDIWKEIETLLNKNVTTTKEWVKEQEDATKEWANQWDEAINKISNSFNTFKGLLDDSRSSLTDIFKTKKKDRSKEDKKRIKGLDIDEEEFDFFGGFEKNITKMSDLILTGKFRQAVDFLVGASDEAPMRWQGNFEPMMGLFDKLGIKSNGFSEIFGGDMDKIDASSHAALSVIAADWNGFNPFQTFSLGIDQVDLKTAKMAAGLADLAKETTAAAKEQGTLGTVWDQFYSKLPDDAKQLGIVKDAVTLLNAGYFDQEQAMQFVTGGLQNLQQQMGSTVTSIENMTTKTVDLGDGTTTTLANIDGQWVKLGDNIKTAVDGKIVPGVQTVNNEVAGVAPAAETGLAPVEGIFSAAFLKATIAATGQMSLILADITLSMKFLKENISKELDAITLKFDGLAIPLQNTNDKFKLLDTNVKTYMSNITVNVDNMRSSVTTDLKSVDAGFLKTQEASSKLSTSVKAHTDSMEANITDWANKTVTAFGTAIKKANEAINTFKAVAAAVKAIPDTKTITIKYNVQKKPELQHGGAFITDHREDFGGATIGEFSKPELVTVTPLSNSHNIADKSINMDIGSSLNPLKKQLTSGISSMVSGGGVSASPSMPSSITVTLVMPNGEVLLRQIQPLLLRNYSSIT